MTDHKRCQAKRERLAARIRILEAEMVAANKMLAVVFLKKD